MNVESLSNAWRGSLSCEECSTRLTVFRKKKVCHFCKNSFCQLCIIRREDKKFCCQKCEILTARPLDRNKLLNLRSRDLINYLTSRQIPTNGCLEKEDLVNVLIKAVNNSCFHPSSTACFDSKTCSNSLPNSRSNLDSTTQQGQQYSEDLCNDGIRITGYTSQQDDDDDDDDDESQPYQYETRIPFNEPEANKQHPNYSRAETDRLSDSYEDVSDDETTFSETGLNSYLDEHPQEKQSVPINKPLMLSDIKSRSDIDALSIKQLKELLLRNRTDFKGCVERAELIHKAARLWSDYTLSRKDIDNLSLEELCKICMDAPIECVLLECGHMATCTSCGKQLCECPICRQFVVRCVRTYKA